mgnify:CR=1 FL=1
MSFGRQVYEFLLSSSQAYAKWDLEVSTSILKNRKKMLILLALALPILAGCLAEAYEYHEMLGGKTAYAPAFYTNTIFLASIAVGLAAGLITGCIGAGGGFIITPALMAAGVKGILAVGTDLFHIFAKAIMGTTVHKKLGNVSGKLAVAFLAGSIIGTFIGGAINKGLYNADPLLSELFISSIYAVLLGFLGFYALFDFLKSSRGGAAASQDAHGGSSGMTGLANAVFNQHDIILVILDNGTTAMTGHQPNPGMVQDMLGSMSQHMDIETIVRAMGVTQCTKVRSFNVKAVTKALEEMKAQSGVRVLITEEPCVLYARRQLKKAQPQVAEVAEQGPEAMRCLEQLACPAFYREGDNLAVDATLCTGCMVCLQVAPTAFKARKR